MLRVRQIKVEVTLNQEEMIRKIIAKKLKIALSEIKDFTIEKQSIDARNKNEIFYVYEVNVSVNQEDKILKKIKNADVFLAPNNQYQFPTSGTKQLDHKIIIVGSGPAGLFCSYLLAEHGYKPLIIERGEKIEDRIQTVNTFWKTGKLNPNSNVQFGEGGAGTFSDGKLNTLVNDNIRNRKVFEIFVECGAPKEILYSYKPHIGTDILVTVIQNMRNKIIAMGGEFLYHTCLTDCLIENNELKEIEINHQEKIPCNCLVLAIGHSSRDTFEMLLKRKLELKAKPFAVGIRVMHRQEDINQSQYGEKYKDQLGSASYKLTYKASNGRGVYSFCMCPGGYVVDASSEENRLVINGMSNYKRDTKNANSAVIVTVFPKDFGTSPLAGVTYQRQLEEKAYQLGNGKIPIQLLKDFMKNQESHSFGKVEPMIKGKYQFANLNQLLTGEINQSLKEAFPSFGKKIKGFDDGDTILAGIESRTSSPIRIERDESLEANIKGIYPCGEGAGYAGGITSASIDGIKVAEKIAEKYQI